jgi:hypothetical protein
MSSYYIVYNVHKFKQRLSTSLYPEKDLIELMSLILNSPYAITFENHISDDGLNSELRVIWWSKQSYEEWANLNRKRYDELTALFDQCQKNANVEYLRITSEENYVSKFPYTHYPDKNNLIDWMLIPYFKQYFIDHIIPLGWLKEHIEKDILLPPKTLDGIACRYIKDRSSNIIRRPVSKRAAKDKAFPILLSYSFDQVIVTAMNKTPWLYRQLLELNRKCEQLAEQFIIDCDHAAVLVGHKSLGDGLDVHTHRVSDIQRYSLTIVVRLSFNGQGVKSKFYDPFNDNDTLLQEYYANPNLLDQYIKDRSYTEILFSARTSILVFNAALTPHDVEYDDDIYLYYVYDNVTFKENALDIIKKNNSLTNQNNLYFFDYQKVALE